MFGWSDTSADPLVRIALLDSLRLADPKVIDITSTTVPQEKGLLITEPAHQSEGGDPFSPLVSAVNIDVEKNLGMDI